MTEDIITKEFKDLTPVRDIDTITGEIKEICRAAQTTALIFAIELGRRLEEAKAMLPHGEWGEWLRTKVEFSQSTANNYMRIFDEYGDRQISIFGAVANSQTLGNLPYTKALKLLAIPADEREDFAIENDVENLSSRELDRLIKERDEALRRAEDAEAMRREAEEAEKEAASKAAEADSALKAADELREKVKELTENLNAEKAISENLRKNPDKKVISALEKKLSSEAKVKAEADVRKQIEELTKQANEKIDAAAEARRQAELAAAEAKAKAEELQKKTQLMNADAVEFKTIFNSVQLQVARLKELTAKIEADDAELAGKLRSALKAFFAKAEG